MNQGKIDAVADALAEAYRNGGTVPELDEAILPTNWQEAFQVQDALDERLGFEVAGWKIGCTSRVQMQEFEMDHPLFFGREYRYFTQHSPARFRMADFRHAPMIEGEFALRLGHDLPPREQAYSAAEVRDAVTDVVMAIDGEATFIGCDVADEAAVAAAVNKAAATYGAINILFNNAGGGSMENFPNESSEEFSRIVRVNLVGTFNMSQAVWPHLIEAGGGSGDQYVVARCSAGNESRDVRGIWRKHFGLLGCESRCRSADAFHGRDWGQTPHSSQLRASRPDHDGGSHGWDPPRS